MGRKKLTDEERLIKKEQSKEKQRIKRASNPEKYREINRISALRKREERNEKRKQYRIQNMELIRERERESYSNNREKILARAKLDRLHNPEKYKKYRTIYRLKNPEKIAKYSKKWEENNKDKRAVFNEKHRYIRNFTRAFKRKTDPIYREKCNIWAKLNKDKRCANEAKRRARKLNSTPPWLTDKDWKDISRFYTVSSLLTKFSGVKYTVDHIHPLQGSKVCGLHVPWNLQILTNEENARKNNRLN